MTKEVLISVKGLSTSPENESDTVEIISPGEYYFRNGKHYVMYEELLEGQTEMTKTVIKMADDFMEVTRKGPVAVHMMFERNKKNVTYYNTPVGSLLIGIEASKIDFTADEDEIVTKVLYSLEMNYEHISVCDIEVKVTPKGETFSLS